MWPEGNIERQPSTDKPLEGFIMITRRGFIASVSAALTLPLVNKFTWYLEKKGRPFIDAPEYPSQILRVYPDRNFQICLDGDPWDIPTQAPSWRYYFLDCLGEEEPGSLSSFHYFFEKYGIRPTQLDKNCDELVWLDYWTRNESPDADAYRLLESLRIGSDLSAGEGVGGLTFINSDTNVYRHLGVHADDEISLSLLQHRLNVIGTEIAVEVIT